MGSGPRQGLRKEPRQGAVLTADLLVGIALGAAAGFVLASAAAAVVWRRWK